MGAVALLFSGGLDSVCALHLLKGVQPVYVRIGAKYEAQELAVAHAMTDRLHVLSGPDLGYLEECDGHIRHRNAALAVTVATAGYRVIYLGALRGEASPDKSVRFMRDLGRLLTTSEAAPHLVAAPFARVTKTGLVRATLAAGCDPDRLLASRSCYAAALGHCGACQACFRRWVALENSGLDAGYLPALPGADGAWRHLKRAGLRRWPDVLVNNLDAARAVLRHYGEDD